MNHRLDGADAPYWQGLERGLLLLPRCRTCAHWCWPAGHRCSACGSTGMVWEERPLRAKVYSWTRTWHRFGYTESLDLPYVTVVAELEDCAVRLMGRMDDPAPANPRIGEALIGRVDETVVGQDRIPTIVWSRAA
ncbi:Zn-ribbon domain-containing OB-fold protein [Novosphingobium sp. UBA1939]|uniref:Zn-ribbon domain-containing OB-fold protein n=1 Tax=Novosphingobium sp. UBA1939 TaxID=1946982 RepID=UPI0025E86DC3|nr:OB-fold domain-containing protein [Novosphingobium sp. UBA1939]